LTLSDPTPARSSFAVTGEARVLVGLSLDPPRQNRWTIFFRLLLALPLVVAAIFVSFAGVVAAIGAWFASLFTGRVPDALQNFMTGTLRVYSNILAYQFLLTSRWPGIVFEEGTNDQLTVRIDHVPLNRAAVFFRIILGYPAVIVGGILSIGSYPLLVVMWFWGLLAGREPQPLHQTLALILRYQVRIQAYVLLLTPTQPFRGLFGDETQTTPSALDVPDGASSPLLELPTNWRVARDTRTYVIVTIVLGAFLYVIEYGHHL
jgi:hypothetical protein